jgi:hypothetical protein
LRNFSFVPSSSCLPIVSSHSLSLFFASSIRILTLCSLACSRRLVWTMDFARKLLMVDRKDGLR